LSLLMKSTAIHKQQTGSAILNLNRQKQELLQDLGRSNGTALLRRHAEILDDYFRDRFASSAIGPRMQIDRNPYAIVALGGYGRREQCLHSDVDVLLLFHRKVPPEAKDLVQEILYPLWDLGLEVGHASRSLKECLSLAAEDLEVLTALIDARFLCGISSLYSDLRQGLRTRLLGRNRDALVRWLARSNLQRHLRYGDSTYLLEPNLKEGVGGLRDYHTMLWLGWAKYDLQQPRDLEYQGHLSHSEYLALGEALSFIWTVRNWLHYITGRRCDQLYFDYQIPLAESMGFEEHRGQRPVERFLGILHGHMECVKQLHLSFLDKAVPPKRKVRLAGIRRRLRGSGIEWLRQSNTLTFAAPENIPSRPQLLLRIFERSSRFQLPLSMEAKRLVQEFLYLIDDNFRSSPQTVHMLRRLLMAPGEQVDVLDDLFTTGLLPTLIPELRPLINRIQYDEYHLYPVDKHSLRTVQTVKRFGSNSDDTEDLLCTQLIDEVEKPELLLWAALFHDVGKGAQGKDHASRGAAMVRTVFSRMGFAREDIETISFLVQYHLLLVRTATQRDLNDEKVIVQCARTVADLEHLRMLYLLTVADCMATGPKAWNDWIAVLLKELFFKLRHIISGGELASPSSVKVVAAKQRQVLQRSKTATRQQVAQLFEQMSPRYLLAVPATEILRHIALYERLGNLPFVLEVQPPLNRRYRTLVFCAKDHPGLFAKISGVLTLNNLNILSAQIYTWRNQIALDIFEVTAPPDSLHEEEAWDRVRDNLFSVLQQELDLDAALRDKMRTCRYALSKTTVRADEIVVDNTSSDFFTIIEVYTHDFPGLLYKITSTISRLELDIWVAKIATKVDQVVDIFYVRDLLGQKVDSPEQVARIKRTIAAVLRDKPA